MLNDISNRERFDILIEEFCKEIEIPSAAEDVKNHQAFLANDYLCKLEFNASFDPDRAYVFVEAALATKTPETVGLEARADEIEDGTLGYIHPESDRWIYAVVPFSLTETTVDDLSNHVLTAIQGAKNLQPE